MVCDNEIAQARTQAAATLFCNESNFVFFLVVTDYVCQKMEKAKWLFLPNDKTLLKPVICSVDEENCFFILG